jgi:hypothetical protein
MSFYRRLTEADLRRMLGERKVAPEIIERVVRLNPNAVEGDMLRGIHYKCRDDLRWWGYVPKGQYLRRFGREAFGRLRPEAIRKRGRRVFIAHSAVAEAAA